MSSMTSDDFVQFAKETIVTCSRERIKLALLYEHHRSIGKRLKRLTIGLSLISVMLGTIQFTLPNLDANLDIWNAILAALVAAAVQLSSYLKPDKKRAIATANSNVYQETIRLMDDCTTPERLSMFDEQAIVAIRKNTEMTMNQLRSDEDLPGAVRKEYDAICKEGGFSNDLITIPRDVSRIRSLSATTGPSASSDGDIEMARLGSTTTTTTATATAATITAESATPKPGSLRRPRRSVHNPVIAAAMERLQNSSG